MMTGPGAVGRRTLQSPSLVAVLAALAFLLSLALAGATGDLKLQMMLVAGLIGILVSLLVLARPAAFGLPLLVVVIFSNASDLLTRLFSIPSVLQAMFVLALVSLVVWRNRFQPLLVLRHPVSLLLATFGLVLFITSAWASNPAFSDERTTEVFRGFLLFVIVATLAGSSLPAFRRAVAALLITAAGLASLSLFQVVSGRYDQQFGRFAAVQFGHLFGEVREARIAGPLDDPNFYAQILLMAIPLGISLAITARGWARWAFFSVATVAVSAAMLLTYSRGAMLALVVMLALLPLVVRVRRRVVAGGVAVAVAILLLLAPTDLGRRLATIPGSVSGGSGIERDSSVAKRKLLLGAAWGMFVENPIGGVGAGNFDENYRPHARRLGSSAPQYDEHGETQYPHSLFAEVAAETGLMGLLVFGGMLVVAYRTSILRARRMRHEGRVEEALLTGALTLTLTGYLVAALFLHGAFERYLWLALALIVAADRLYVQTTHQDQAVPG